MKASTKAIMILSAVVLAATGGIAAIYFYNRGEKKEQASEGNQPGPATSVKSVVKPVQITSSTNTKQPFNNINEQEVVASKADADNVMKEVNLAWANIFETMRGAFKMNIIDDNAMAGIEDQIKSADKNDKMLADKALQNAKNSLVLANKNKLGSGKQLQQAVEAMENANTVVEHAEANEMAKSNMADAYAVMDASMQKVIKLISADADQNGNANMKGLKDAIAALYNLVQHSNSKSAGDYVLDIGEGIKAECWENES